MRGVVFSAAMIAFIVLFGTGMYHIRKPLPSGVSVAGEIYHVPAESISFFSDKTYVDEEGVRHSDQQIFDDVMRMVREAEKYILLDMFLFNDYQGENPETTRQLFDELVRTLVEKKQESPDVVITVVSDPINTVYDGSSPSHFSLLEENGISVVITDLSPLRDSNPIYTSLWRVFVQWFGNSEGGSISHPFSSTAGDVSLRSWLELVNFKANHRKLVVADSGGQMSTLVTSANPHDGSSAHTNIAVRIDDGIWRDAIASERAVGVFSGADIPQFAGTVSDRTGDVIVQLLMESAIRDAVVEHIRRTISGDSIDIAMFYISERSVVRELIAASKRGVRVRLVLDPNKDAFGYTKNGVPNRPVADELVKKSGGGIEVRWCDTHGEQCHSKMVLFQIGDEYVMVLGSANLTRRNIADYNLETNVLVSAREKIPAIADAYHYMDDVWNNGGGRIYTADYTTYEDTALYKKIMYRVQEKTGLTSF